MTRTTREHHARQQKLCGVKKTIKPLLAKSRRRAVKENFSSTSSVNTNMFNFHGFDSQIFTRADVLYWDWEHHFYGICSRSPSSSSPARIQWWLMTDWRDVYGKLCKWSWTRRGADENVRIKLFNRKKEEEACSLGPLILEKFLITLYQSVNNKEVQYNLRKNIFVFRSLGAHIRVKVSESVPTYNSVQITIHEKCHPTNCSHSNFHW